MKTRLLCAIVWALLITPNGVRADDGPPSKPDDRTPADANTRPSQTPAPGRVVSPPAVQPDARARTVPGAAVGPGVTPGPRPLEPLPLPLPPPALIPPPATGGRGAASSAGAAYRAASALGFGRQPVPTSGGLFGGPVAGPSDFAGLGQSGIPQMIGDQGPGLRLLQATPNPPPATIPQPFPPPHPPAPPSPSRATALVPAVRGLKIAENQSPRPQDRFFFTFDYFSNVNGALNQRLGAPVSGIRVYRYIFGFEKTFDDGNASIGVRLPLDQLTANTRVPARYKQIGGTSTALDDMNVYGKFVLREDRSTGSLISVGMAVTPTTASGKFAGAPYINYINTTMFQPFVGYIWNRGDFYLHGFSAFEFPINPSQVTEMYNDVGVGYFVYRAPEPDRWLTAVAPTFEVHVNSPLNHRGFDNPHEVAGTPTVVNLTYGINFEISHDSLLTFGFVNPVTGPRPFDYEALILFNYRFGRSKWRPTPPVISG